MSKWSDDLEQLTKGEFDMHVKNLSFRLAFVGMSNAGKTFRSRVLHNELDFFWYHVDGEIQKKLGYKNMEEISEWLGYPDSAGYEEKERKYLATEELCTKLDSLDTEEKNLVFDTTGSVIYLGEKTLSWLKNECLIVHIDIEESDIERMAEKFFKHLKPVVWNRMYSRVEGETREDAFLRCYPGLLKNRLEKYRKLAHMSIQFKELYDKSAPETLSLIRDTLWM